MTSPEDSRRSWRDEVRERDKVRGRTPKSRPRPSESRAQSPKPKPRPKPAARPNPRPKPAAGPQPAKPKRGPRRQLDWFSREVYEGSLWWLNPKSWTRGVWIAIVTVTVLALVGAGFAAKSYLQNKRAEDKAAAQEIAIADAQVVPVPCEVAKLEFAVGEIQARYSGQPVSVSMTVTNRLGRSCFIDLSEAKLGAVITTGKETVFNSLTCAADAPEKKILFDADMPWALTVSWDGKIKNANCEGARVSGAGTYRVQMQLQDKLLGKAVPFVLEAPPPPPKPAKDKDKDKAKKTQ